MIYKYFPQCLGCLCYNVDAVLWFSICCSFSCLVLLLLHTCFWCDIHKVTAKANMKAPLYFLLGVVASGVTLRSLVHFELILEHGMTYHRSLGCACVGLIFLTLLSTIIFKNIYLKIIVMILSKVHWFISQMPTMPSARTG